MIKIYVKKIILIFVCVAMMLLLCSCTKLHNRYNKDYIMANMNNYFFDSKAEGTANNLILPEKNNDKTVNVKYEIESYIVCPVNANSNKFFYKKPYKRMPMASLTKLMTALIVLENADNLDVSYKVSADAVKLEKAASKADLLEGDTVTLRQLLYGLLIPSGNDCANVIAENFDENKENFMILMNNEAERIGCLNTHFSNAHGLDADFHFTSAYDVYIILQHLLKYPIFKEISSLESFDTKVLQDDGTYRDLHWRSTNGFLGGGYILSDKAKILGSKTGSTNNAGYCIALVTKSTVSDEEYMIVCLNATSKLGLYSDANALINNTH